MTMSKSKSYTRPPVDFLSQKEPTPLSQRDSYRNVKGTPLFELLSVRARVSNHTFDAGPFQIFGKILLIDEHGNEFCLFRQKRSNPKIVFPHQDTTSDDGTTSLVILHNFDLQTPRCLPTKFYLTFFLKDKHGNFVFDHDYHFIDCTQVVTYDKVQTIRFLGGDVEVDFIILRCALLATVSIVVEKTATDDSDFSRAQVSGSITAFTEMSDKRFLGRSLYDESEELVFGALQELSTFAVPCYSLLELEVDVEIEGDRFLTCLKYAHDDWFFSPYLREIQSGRFRIRVYVLWGLASKILPEYHDIKWPSNEGFEESLRRRTNRKRPRGRSLNSDQLCYIQPRLEALNSTEWDISENPVALMEIFSISICSFDGDGLVLGLKGKILASDEDKTVFIFNGDMGSESINSNETVKLKSPERCYNGEHFGIALDLKDGQGHGISTGLVSFDFSNVHSFFNRRICSIIRGQHGFAALHYSIFGDAIQAKLGFTLMHCPDTQIDTQFKDQVQVRGQIKTRYSNFNYSTHYEKKYYQSTIFEESDFKVVESDLGVISLSESVVAVPLNASLIVSAEVHVLFEDEIETLHYFQTFGPGVWKLDHSQGPNFCIKVSLEWDRDF